MYYFKKKIKCLNCGGGYRGITERGTKRYYCSTYHNKRSCVRWTITEDWLIDLIYNHYQISLIKDMRVTGKGGWYEISETVMEEVLSRVVGVEVHPIQKEVTVRFKDETSAFMSSTRQTYWTNEK